MKHITCPVCGKKLAKRYQHYMTHVRSGEMIVSLHPSHTILAPMPYVFTVVEPYKKENAKKE